MYAKSAFLCIQCGFGRLILNPSPRADKGILFMIDRNALSDKRLATSNVGLNLTRLISGASGAGGAGVFALFLARALAQISNLSIYVLRENRDLVDKYLRRNADAFERTQVRIIDTDDFQVNLARAAAGCSVWIDPSQRS